MRAWRPVAYRRPTPPSPALGQTFDEMLGLTPLMGDVLRLVYHGGGTWLGLHVALTPASSTLLKVVGWILAGGMGLAALLDVVSVAKRAAGTHPPLPAGA